MDKVFVTGMKFYAYHGVFPEENKLGQRFIVDVALEADLKEAAKSDDIEKSVDYGEVYKAAKQVLEGRTYNLVESIAEEVAAQVLKTFSIVERTTVKVIKPDPPIPGHYDHVAIEIVRDR
ncbi:dihydroneopterin aldolase [Salicibibacter halophilus]|uniref:7,8-dihydroneopterin aldolase n=1 Tax=Salicibibacter halophilus TaxID=2502791 RepID=A0A514LJ12_9BACI|nr:dihydroneopterin aldolase [Salicibibacter halophilus]QDI91535.1 dihydroneopterin aldolase [Salicibibacter halophilus]